MSDTINEPVTIKLTDGVERNLRYSLGSCRRLKKQFGASVFLGDGLKGLDEDKLPALLFEGLRQENGETPPGLTEEMVADLMDLPAIPKLLDAFAKAWAGSVAVKNVESSPKVQDAKTAETPTVN